MSSTVARTAERPYWWGSTRMQQRPDVWNWYHM